MCLRLRPSLISLLKSYFVLYEDDLVCKKASEQVISGLTLEKEDRGPDLPETQTSLISKHLWFDERSTLSSFVVTLTSYIWVTSGLSSPIIPSQWKARTLTYFGKIFHKLRPVNSRFYGKVVWSIYPVKVGMCKICVTIAKVLASQLTPNQSSQC